MGTVPPTNVAGFDIQSDFVAKSHLFKLVGVKRFDVTHCHEEVRTINRHQRVVEGVANLPVFKQDLSRRRLDFSKHEYKINK